MKPTHRVLLMYAVLGVLLLAAAVLGAAFGASGMGLAGVREAIGQPGGTNGVILFGIRLPRVALSMLVGAALALSGAMMQGVFQNPMADPHILGVSSGAALGAAVAMVLLGSTAALAPVAFVFGLGTAILVWMLSKNGTTVTLILAGTAVSAFLSALVSALLLLDREGLERVYLWTMGSFTAATWEKVWILLPVVVLGAGLSLLLSKSLNALLLGDEQAASLGVDVRRSRLLAILLSSLLTSCAVAMSGVIGFVGLMVPHALRFLVGPKHENLLPLSALGGALLLSLMDTLSRSLLPPVEIPVGVLTSLLGAPFFLYLLRKNLKRGR